jgi:NADP-dependent 3-hydroxy acid dehydrogenase YdfG
VLCDRKWCNKMRVQQPGELYPGRTATPLQASLCHMEGRKYLPENLLQPEDVAAVIIHSIALPHTAEITEIMIRPAVKS